jgi:HEAT repeat protein
VHTESTEYAQARDALEEMGKGVLPFLNNPTELGKSGEESEDPQRRLLAVDFLREIGDAVALPALKEAAATDKDAQVREAAEAAVRKMEGP